MLNTAPARTKISARPSRTALQVDLLRAGDDDAAHIGVHLAPLEDLGRLHQVLPAPVGAGADDRLVDRHLAHLAQRPGVAGQVREGDLRLDGS